jgi:hypothetical protein
MVGECLLTLLLRKAVQEGERDEAEEDDKENSTADHSLGLWAVAQQQVGGGGRGKRRGHSLLPGLQVIQNGFFLFFFF